MYTIYGSGELEKSFKTLAEASRAFEELVPTINEEKGEYISLYDHNVRLYSYPE